MDDSREFLRIMREYDTGPTTAMKAMKRAENYINCFQTGYLKALEDLQDDDVDILEMDDDELKDHMHDHISEWIEGQFL